MSIIQSVSNPNVKRIVELQTNAGQKEYKQFIAEGEHSIQLFLENNFTLDQLYTLSEQLPKAYKLVATDLQANEHLVTVVTEQVLAKISTAVTPSGLLAVFKLPDNPVPTELTKSVALVNIQDPGNMGTLIRSAAALAIKTIIKIDGVNCWSPKVVQASAGTLALVTIVSMKWEDFVQEAHAQKLQLFGMVVQHGKKPHELSFDNSILVIGNEAHGLTQAQQAACDQLFTLPMPGKTESLNVAVAGSIGLYVAFFNSTNFKR